MYLCIRGRLSRAGIDELQSQTCLHFLRKKKVSAPGVILYQNLLWLNENLETAQKNTTYDNCHVSMMETISGQTKFHKNKLL